MYLDYWKLDKPPFDNMPDPAMYFGLHRSVDDAVSEVLFAIEEGNDCLAVVVGPSGVGKTTCLRVVQGTLEWNRYQTAFITNPDLTFPQLLREIVGQLEGAACSTWFKDDLLERFDALLSAATAAGRKIVVFIDEGGAISSACLESLRLLTNMQADSQSVFTIVLAGEDELAEKLEDPRHDSLVQRTGVHCRLEGLDSCATMKDYIEFRLEKAGYSGTPLFTEDAYDAIWTLSRGGLPRLINTMCRLALKSGEAAGIRRITRDVILEAAGRLGHPEQEIAAVTVTPPEEMETILMTAEHGIPQQDDGGGTARGQKVEKVTVIDELLPRHAQPAKKEEQQVTAAAIAEFNVLTRAERERIAGVLAAERMNEPGGLRDPFEDWTKAREEILKEMDSLNPTPAPARHDHIAA